MFIVLYEKKSTASNYHNALYHYNAKNELTKKAQGYAKNGNFPKFG